MFLVVQLLVSQLQLSHPQPLADAWGFPVLLLFTHFHSAAELRTCNIASWKSANGTSSQCCGKGVIRVLHHVLNDPYFKI
jgi:hypothetical protein